LINNRYRRFFPIAQITPLKNRAAADNAKEELTCIVRILKAITDYDKLFSLDLDKTLRSGHLCGDIILFQWHARKHFDS